MSMMKKNKNQLNDPQEQKCIITAKLSNFNFGNFYHFQCFVALSPTFGFFEKKFRKLFGTSLINEKHFFTRVVDHEYKKENSSFLSELWV